MVKSIRIISGRFLDITIGASIPPPMAILPVKRMELRARSLSMPPRASAFLARISSTVRSAACIETAQNRAMARVKRVRERIQILLLDDSRSRDCTVGSGGRLRVLVAEVAGLLGCWVAGFLGPPPSNSAT